MEPALIASTAAALLSPYLVKAAEEVGKRLPQAVCKVWDAIKAKFRDKVSAEEAVKDLVAAPEDADNVASFRKELKKLLETDPNFTADLSVLLKNAESETGDTIVVTGSGASATKGGGAAGKGGSAVKGDVHGNIQIANVHKDD